MYRNIRIAPATFALLCLGATLSVEPTAAQTAKDMVGTWTNISNINIRQDGSRVPTYSVTLAPRLYRPILSDRQDARPHIPAHASRPHR